MPDDVTQIQIDFLNFLRSRPRSYFSDRQIREKLQLSNQKFGQCLQELTNWGYVIDRNASGGLKYVSSPDLLFPHEIERGLKTKVLGRYIYSYDRVGSTNTLAERYAQKGAPEGTLVIAERQTKGRGRFGRSWASPPKKGLYLSLILRPPISASKAPGLSLIAAVSVAETIRQCRKLPATIKWPNDILIGDKKAAGVLSELTAETDSVKFIITGIGINVNQSVGDFPESLSDKATSLKLESGKDLNRITLLQQLLRNLDKRYQSFLKQGLRGQTRIIRQFSAILKKRIYFMQDEKRLSGIAVDIDENGMLIVQVGERKLTLNSGEVSLSENY